MPSTTASTSEPNLSSKPSLEQLRSHLSGKPLARFEPCRRSDGRMGADRSENRDNCSVAHGSGIDANLLSPPLSVDSLDTPPFKPADSDQTSLSMKNRRRRGRSRRHREGLDHASTGDAEEQSLHPHSTSEFLTSTSVPDLRQNAASQQFFSAAGQSLMRQQLQALHVAHRRDSIARSLESKRRASLPQKPRRWTMPSKAPSTRVLSESPTPMITTSIIPSKDQQELSRATAATLNTSHQSLPSSSQAENDGPSTNASETPAMITLRRASKKATPSILRRTSLRPHAITSFPPPKFNRTTSAYFSSFFGLNSPRIRSKNDDPIQTSVRQSSWSTGQDSISPLRKASVTADRVQLSANTIAAPAFTQVEFLPLSHSHANQQELYALSARRCSTTIVSGSSVHEIIWDENITSSSEGSTDAEISRQTSKTAKRSQSRDPGRRQSMLVEKLEAQLRDNDQRRASLGSQNSDSTSTSADGHERTKSRLQKLTGWNQGAPSKANKPSQYPSRTDLKPKLNHDLSTVADGLFATLHAEEVSPTTEHVGFFPPLDGSAGNSQRSSVSREQLAHPEPKHVSIEEPSSVLTFGAQALCEPVSKDEERVRDPSVQASTLRRPSVSDHPLSMGLGIGQSSHLRRRSTYSRKPSISTWSRSASKHQLNEHDESDDRTPLLAFDEQSSDDFARPSLFFDGQNVAGQRAGDARPRKMSVQDFVHQIERMSHGQLRQLAERSEDEPRVLGLVRRDSPWVVRRVSVAVADTDQKREGGIRKVLSEVGEEVGFIRSISGEGSEVLV